MRIILLATFIVAFSSASFAQTNNEVLTMKNGFFGWEFRKNEQRLKMGEVADLLKNNPEASERFASARSNNTVATILGGVGGFLLGYTLGSSAGGGKANWSVGGAGGGLVVAGLVLSVKANNQARRAVTLYNEGLKTGFLRQPELKLGITENGAGLVLNF